MYFTLVWCLQLSVIFLFLLRCFHQYALNKGIYRLSGNNRCNLVVLFCTLAIFTRSLPDRNNGHFRSNGSNGVQHKKHIRAFQLTRKSVNYRASSHIRFSERMGRGGLAKGHKKRKRLAGKGRKATLIASTSWLSTRLSLPGNKPDQP